MMWDWLFTDVETGVESNDLLLSINKPVKLVMSSRDVLHGFYAPDFPITKDVLPNQYTVVWFKPEKEGVFPILCSQYYGTKHSQMVRFARVMSEEKYKEEIKKAQGAGLTPVQYGENIFKGKRACISCHDISKEKKKIIGPPFYDAFEKERKVTLRDGGSATVLFDENYTREAILDPNAKIPVGYGATMPTYK